MQSSRFFILFSGIFLLHFSVKAQDTLHLTLQQADSIFLKNSYYLLASSLQIEAKKAMLFQEKLYPNPIFSADFTVYDPENKKAFHVGESGQKTIQLEQLILIGGKRKLAIEMAKSSVSVAELEFQQLIRNLKYQLHSNLFALGQDYNLLQKYDAQLALLEGLLTSYQIQVDKGSISLKELIRLKGAYLKLNNDRAELRKNYFQTQTTIQKILQVSRHLKFNFSEKEISDYVKIIPENELKETAILYRPDLLIVKENKDQAEIYLNYQKKIAIPDLHLITSYDQRGGAFRNQINFGFSMPLPVWNRNQGTIRAADFGVQEMQYRILQLENEVQVEIQNAYAFYSNTLHEFQKATELYNADFELALRSMTENFQKRNISLIEFIDFFESYNEALTEITRLKAQLVSSAEELNLLVGKDIY